MADDAFTARTTVATRFTADGTRRTFAQPLLSRFFAGVIAVATIAVLAPLTTKGSAIAVRTETITAAAISILLTWRVWRPALVIDGHSLTVRSVLRTVRLAASSIAHFEVAKPYGAVRGNGIRIELNDGRTVSSGVFGNSPIYSSGGGRQVDELNDWLNHDSGLIAQFRRAPSGLIDRRPVWVAGVVVVCVCWLFELVILISLLVAPTTFGS